MIQERRGDVRATFCIALTTVLLLSHSYVNAAQEQEPVVQLQSMDSTDMMRGHGVTLSIVSDCVEGTGAMRISGSGHVRFSADAFKGIDVGSYDRLVMDFKIPAGHVTDFGLVTRGFPQVGEIESPRWAKYDESTPSGAWLEYSCNLRLCEWNGGRDNHYAPEMPALSFIFTPGKGNSSVLVDNLRLIRDPVRVLYDWLDPVKPIRIKKHGGKTQYEKEIEIQNVSAKPVALELRFSKESVKKFKGHIIPDTASIQPGAKKVFLVQIDVPDRLKPLEYELQEVQIIPDGNTALIQRVEILTAAPFPPVKHPFTVKKTHSRAVKESLLTAMPTNRLPKGPCVWMSQSALNTNGSCEDRHKGQKPAGFDRLKCDTCGKVQEGTNLCGGIFHRLLIQHLGRLGQAYQKTKDRRYAQAARQIFLTYARDYHKYKLSEPLMEASSYLAPNNATYVLGTVVMTPLTRALDLIWDSGVLSADDKKKIAEGLFWPGALEMMKINPGMTNMQDAMTEAIFNMGLLLNDPNLTAIALYGSHGLSAKIGSVIDDDGATPESIAANYHYAAIRPVLAQVASIRNSELTVDLSFDRLEKAKTLMSYMRMPDGRIPNRGDSGFPAGKPDAELFRYGSMTFRHYGMTVLREGEGEDAVYVALDHRPPAVTHSHYDKLGIILYGKGEYLGVDEGSLYNNDNSKQTGLPNWGKRSAWHGHSLVHNTITVDKKSQNFGGGKLLYYHGDKGDYQAVAAMTDNVYGGVILERNIVLLDGIILMVDRCLSDSEHTYDWAHHSFGDLQGPKWLKPTEHLDSVKPYDLPENAKMGESADDAFFRWTRKKASLGITILSENGQTEYGTAVGWANKAYRLARQDAPMVMARRRGKNVHFVTILEPFKGDTPEIMTVERIPVRLGIIKRAARTDAIGVKITKRNGRTIYFLVSFTEGKKKCGPIETEERCFAALEDK